MGTLDKFNVKMIGATAEAIDKAEDRELFRNAMTKIGLATPRSHQIKTLAQALGMKTSYTHPREIMDEIARLTPSFSGVSYTKLDGIPLGRYWRPLFAWFGDLDLVPHLWQMTCLGETEAVVTFFPPVDIDKFGDRKKLAEFCFRQVSAGVQSANSGRPELLPPLEAAAG